MCEYSSAGCRSPLALNYDSRATIDDGSCVVASPSPPPQLPPTVPPVAPLPSTPPTPFSPPTSPLLADLSPASPPRLPAQPPPQPPEPVQPPPSSPMRPTPSAPPLPSLLPMTPKTADPLSDGSSGLELGTLLGLAGGAVALVLAVALLYFRPLCLAPRGDPPAKPPPDSPPNAHVHGFGTGMSGEPQHVTASSRRPVPSGWAPGRFDSDVAIKVDRHSSRTSRLSKMPSRDMRKSRMSARDIAMGAAADVHCRPGMSTNI